MGDNDMRGSEAATENPAPTAVDAPASPAKVPLWVRASVLVFAIALGASLVGLAQEERSGKGPSTAATTSARPRRYRVQGPSSKADPHVAGAEGFADRLFIKLIVDGGAEEAEEKVWPREPHQTFGSSSKARYVPPEEIRRALELAREQRERAIQKEDEEWDQEQGR
jgi:hypothetical protein